jgi:hypothetical protein
MREGELQSGGAPSEPMQPLPGERALFRSGSAHGSMVREAAGGYFVHSSKRWPRPIRKFAFAVLLALLDGLALIITPPTGSSHCLVGQTL